MAYLYSESSSDSPVQLSADFGQWLQQHLISLAFTTYQTNRLMFVGSQRGGQIHLHERLFDKPMGLYAQDDRLYMSTRYQIWQFDNWLGAGETYQEADRLYLPKISYTTGNLNVHDVVLDRNGDLLFVNTDFSCLASLDPAHSFRLLWQPPFISKLVAEDRCHLNGLALVEGEPRYLTACSATDSGAGWRNHRHRGGIVLHLPSNEIIAEGLSMPHSPRFYQGKLWLLNSGSGELGYIESGRFCPLVFCPGFVRGLAFWQDYAFVGLSKLRSKAFGGLALEERLAALGQSSQCGLMVINLKTGHIEHSLLMNNAVEELFDVVVLPGVARPQALGFQNEDIERLVRFPGSQGLVITRPTVHRPSLGPEMAIAGLPQSASFAARASQSASRAEEETAWQRPKQPLDPAVKFQRVYHLNPESLAPYDGMMFPSLIERWQFQPLRGTLVGVSAEVQGNLVAFIIGEQLPDQSGEVISLYVVPAYRHQGIATRLMATLERDWQTEKIQTLQMRYRPSRWTDGPLERLLGRLGWQVRSLGEEKLAQKDLVPRGDSGFHLKDIFQEAKALLQAQDWSGAIACYQKALAHEPQNAKIHCNLGVIWQQQGQIEQAIAAYQRAYELQPSLLSIYPNVVSLLNQIQNGPNGAMMLEQQITLLLMLTVGYLESGFYAQAQGYFENLEMLLLEPEIVLGEKVAEKLHQYLIFSLPYLRDDPAANSRLSLLISQAYIRQCLETFPVNPVMPADQNTGESLRMGVISRHFRRHSVGWCSYGVLRGWSQLTPYLFLYQTGSSSADDLSQSFREMTSHFIDLSRHTPQGMLERLRGDELDVLIDLDSLMNLPHTLLLHQRPAPVVVSWLGCEPPFISNKNYYLCERRTHPQDQQQYYKEQLLYLSQTGVAIEGFSSLNIDPPTLRQSLGIDPDAVVYLSVAPGKKLNPALVQAQVAILQRVPNSLLLYKGSSNPQATKLLYQSECDRMGVASSRCRWLGRQELEEEHRTFYQIADVGLDTYPYNGGTHNLEFLWFNVPLVTYCGKQAVARMGAGFLQSLGIEAGIAHSWDEYIAWGVRYGTEPELRQAVQERLRQSQQTEHRAPLWQPQQLAEESYQLFQNLLDQECRSIVALSPRTSLSVFFREAKALLQAQDWSGAIACYQKALAHEPQNAKIHCNLGAIWQQQGQIEQAIAAYRQAIEYQPQLWVAYQNLLGLYNQTGDFQAAKELVLAALEHHPQVALLHLLLGDIYRLAAETTPAIAAYRTALRWDDQCVSAYQNLGGLLMMVNQIEGAKVCFKKALAIQPDLAGVYRNLGEIYEAEGNYSKALECFNYSLSLEPEELATLYRREHLRLTLCDWIGYEVRMQSLLQRLHGDGMKELAPLSLNCFPALPALHKTINQSWSAAIARRMAIVRQQLGFQYSHRQTEKLRLGYLSADFRNHAVGSLIAPLFQYHDRSQFEIYAYSLSTSQDETTEQIKQGCDHFREIAPLSAEASAQQIYQDGIQILIDLGGYTRLCRPEILALQPAPLQIHYLGYPDTMGAEFVPYILADRQLIPTHLAEGYTESLVELPHTFVTAPLSLPQPPPRQTLGLPDQGVVYACFNRTDKFSPDLFARWMAILQAVPESVLWLAETAAEITTNLRQEAQKHGVDPQRLVFLPKQPLPEFMQLCQQADLFLDTFVYNAGATAVCALQAGVPILTCAGETFAARMGASICQAAQLEEFICPTPAEYQTQGIYWGQHPQQLRAVQERLRTQKAQLPLFQPQAWVLALETQLLALLNRQGPTS